MLRLIKQCFFTGLALSLTLTGLNLLSCISMNNQECKVRRQIVNVNGDDPFFFFLIALKQVNAAVVATTSIVNSKNCVYLMW